MNLARGPFGVKSALIRNPRAMRERPPNNQARGALTLLTIYPIVAFASAR
jgi:hypothetical protein